MHLIKSLATISAVLFGATSATKYKAVLNMTKSGFSSSDFLSPLLSYANGSVWIGDIKSQTYAEPFISSANGGIYFTSFHSTPTGGQSAYIFANESKPLGLTIPHSTSYPQGVITTGITFNSGGYLNFNGENKFIGCQDETAAAIRSYKIYWGGSGTPEGLNCTGPLSIYEMNTCS